MGNASTPVGKNDPFKIYIFISHSHQDLREVRVVRNFLESLNTEPILFFLKSLSDKDKIHSLIKNEIDSRLWFILCDSPNAQASEWVKSEVEYAKGKNKRFQLIIDLEKDFENGDLTATKKSEIRKAINSFTLSSNIYIDYSRRDLAIVRKICGYLENYGIRFFLAHDSVEFNTFNGDFETEIKRKITELPYFISFLSENFFNSPWCMEELHYAQALNKNVLFIYLLNDRSNLDSVPSAIKNNVFFFFDTSDVNASATQLIYYLQKHFFES